MAWIIGIVAAIALLWAFPRQTIVTLVVLFCIGGAVLLYVESEKAAEKSKREAVTSTISYATAGCNAEFPLVIDFFNGTQSTVSSINFRINAHEAGYSDTLTGYNVLHSDKIMAPSEHFIACWAAPTVYRGADAKTVVWEVEGISPNFR